MMLRIGFDVDGILANFPPAYQRLTVALTGKNLFHPGDAKNPPTWDWPEYRGYTKAEMKEVWKHITASDHFNLDLDELPGCSTLRMCIHDLQRWHDIYFVTSRPGAEAKWQSEQWLMLHLGIENPTVLISSMKGLCAKALKLDCYIDDNADNVNDVVEKTLPKTEREFVDAAEKVIALNPDKDAFELADIVKNVPSCRTYLLDASYNREPGIPERPVKVDSRVIRVATVGKFLDAELANL